MRRALYIGLLITVLAGCGQGDSRAQLRDACDDLIAAGGDHPSNDATSQLGDLKRRVNKIAEDSSGSETDTHELARGLWLAIDDGGSVAQIVGRAAATCAQAYDTVK